MRCGCARSTRKEGRKEEGKKKKRGRGGEEKEEGMRRGRKRRERFHFSPPQAPLGFREIRTRSADLCNSGIYDIYMSQPIPHIYVDFYGFTYDFG